MSYQQARIERFSMDRHRCKADGMHHLYCPRSETIANQFQFCTHHVIERQFGGEDIVENLLTVWNGPTGMGRAGCHNVIHEDPVKAELLGYLNRGKGLFGVGSHLANTGFWSHVDIRDTVQCLSLIHI